MVGLIVDVARIENCFPGELVLVVATPGKADPVNKPPGSTVGILSFSNLPISASLGLKMWSTFTISWRRLNVLRPTNGTSTPVPLAFPRAGRGSFALISFTSAAAAALNCVGEIWVVCCVQAPVLGLCCVQTGVKKLPAIFACDGRIGSKLVLVITRRTSSEKKKNVFFLSVL